MGAIWGQNIKLSIFGESHGRGIGINIDGLPSGVELNLDYINEQMKRRAPGKNRFSTPRQESDEVEILSGVFENKTTGAPLCVFIKNQDKKSKDYSKLKEIMRPSHSDYPAYIKYRGFNDVRGGGHFSGRVTAPLVFAGSIAKLILEKKGIKIGARIKQIGKIKDTEFIPKFENLKKLEKLDFAVIDEKKAEKMQEEIEQARLDCNSVGGIIECFALGVEAGLGNPFFDSLESTIAHLAFSVPAVKGIEFGRGFELATMYGAEANDEYYYENGEVKTYTNNNGGILGGISNGQPISFSVVIKPTPSISKSQRSINIKNRENCELVIEGRHDPCIVPRAVVVIESILAIALLEHIL